MGGRDSLWYYVQLSDGDVHRVTLDQLDDGFQAGHIDEGTMVLADRATQWARLGHLAGLDDGPPMRAAASPRDARPADSATAVHPPRPWKEPAARRAPVVPTDRPVSVDLSQVNFEATLRPPTRKRWLVAAVGLAVVACLGAVAVKRPGWARLSNRPSLQATSGQSLPTAALGRPPVSSGVPTPPSPLLREQVPALPLPAQPATAPVVATATVPSSDSAASPRLAEPRRNTHRPGPPPQINPRGRRAKAHKVPIAAAGSHGPPPKSSTTTFTTAGSKYDPLRSGI
jgi:hypothetical protein